MYFNIEKGESWVGYRQKRCFFQLRKDADSEHLFCSNASFEHLSIIVGLKMEMFEKFLKACKAFIPTQGI